MKNSRKTDASKPCHEMSQDEEEKQLSDYRQAAPEVTANGKYRCRYCGMPFDTLKAHDDHYRKIHGKHELI
jgi:rubrerythrin